MIKIRAFINGWNHPTDPFHLDLSPPIKSSRESNVKRSPLTRHELLLCKLSDKRPLFRSTVFEARTKLVGRGKIAQWLA